MHDKTARQKTLVRYKKNSDQSDEFVLPPRHVAHPVVRLGCFTWRLLPEFPSNGKRVSLTCVRCKKQYFQRYPLNSTTLKAHVFRTHGIDVDRASMEAEFSSTQEADTTTNFSFSQDDHFNINSVAGPTEGCSMSKLVSNSFLQRPPGHYGVTLDIEEYTRLLLKLLLSNNLPFSLIDSESFKQFVLFLRDDVPQISRVTLRRRLDELFSAEIDHLRKKFAENTGSFALTMDEWSSGNNYDFLGVTLHFYNNSFQLENYTIGFESLHRKLAYTGEVIHQHLMKVLSDLGIEKRIISITRDNALTMNVAMKYFSDQLSDKGITFNGDIRCVAHILNLSTDAFLKNTFFKANKSESFEQSLEEVLGQNPEFEQFARRMKHLPNIIRSIFVQIRNNHRMKSTFKNLVKEKKTRKSTKRGPEQLLRDSDTRWLSTYNMIDRFIDFREEIAELLRVNHDENSTDFENPIITEEEWAYLKNVRDILETFRLLTIRLRASPYPTINETIPVIYSIMKSFKSVHFARACEENPYIAKGVAEAKQKILQYYPIYGDSISENKMLYLAIVLDPRYKLVIFDRGLRNKKDAIKDFFFEMYDVYEKKMAKDVVEVSDLKLPLSSDPASPPDDESHFVGRRKETDQEHEIDQYLREPREYEDQDIVAFYKARRTVFPVISSMARDVLAACATLAPSESLFSQIGDVVSKKRSRLSPRTIKIIAILRSKGVINSENCSDNLSVCEGVEVSRSTAITGEQEEENAFEESMLLIEEEDDDADISNILDDLSE